MTRRPLKVLLIILTIILTTIVLQTAVRIEVLNIRAGNYLPRRDRNADGSFSDGQWRISLDNSPRDQLRGLVQTFGLAQYVLAPLLLTMAAVEFLTCKGSWVKAVTVSGMSVAAIAMLLMVYRQYYQSLGY